ncbi:MAG: hypothetical protein C0599_17470 [Salinivirgaceae bacterium]|nr:MAG: hypothetical protein C0599_17470 [Salinivirgaceae bacterium]
MKKISTNIGNIAFAVIWLLVFVVPVLLSSENGRIEWYRVFSEWLRMWPFIVVFAVNNWWLFTYFKRKQYKRYFVFVGILIVGLGFMSHLTPLFHNFIGPLGPPRNPGPPNFAPFLFFNTMLVSLLVVGMNNAIRIGVNWVEEQQRMAELEKENLSHQLASLKNQINPHFFMNTLNNIHALIDYNSDMAKNAVLKLSKLMRVLLYETEKDGYTLQKEIGFLNDYIELMRYRMTDNVKITFDYPKVIPEVKIYPLLFISFLENAFKHGIKAQGDSFIKMKMGIDENQLKVSIENTVANKNMEDTGGIGLENARKRLELLYNDNFEMEIDSDAARFKVYIVIPV